MLHAAPRGRRIAAALLLALAGALGIALAAGAAGQGAPGEPPFTGIAWTTTTPQPLSNSEAQGVVVGGKLYSFGGFDSQKGCCTPTSRAYVFDPVASTWSPLAPMPAQNGTQHGGVTHAGMATDGTNVFWAGGYTANASGTGQIFGTDEVWRYNVAANTYTALPDLPAVRAGGQLAVAGGYLHFFGGTTPARGTDDRKEHWRLQLGVAGATWESRAPMPTGRTHFGTAVLGGKIYAVGGQIDHDENLTTLQTVEAYDPATNTWQARAPLPKAVGHISASTISYSGNLLVFGGEVAHGNAITDVVAYDPTANAWSKVSDLPAPRRSGVAGAIGGRLYYSTGAGAETYRGVPDVAGECEPTSDLACSTVKANLPLSLAFGGNEGGLTDQAGRGTGFTMVQPSSAGGGYRAANLRLDGGRLKVTTTKGIAYNANDSQDNALGVGVDSTKALRISTTVVAPPLGTGNSEQAGLWFGAGEDDYVKLVVASAGGTAATYHRVQLLREVNGASAVATGDEINVPATQPAAPRPDHSGTTVRLELVTDPAGKVTGYYRIGNGAVQTLGDLAVDASVFSGAKVPGNVAAAGVKGFAGLFATHRNRTGDQPMDFAFEDFAVESPDAPAGPNVELSRTRIVTNEVSGGAAGPAYPLTIRNTGAQALTIATAITGAEWTATAPSRTTIPAGETATLDLRFNPTSTGVKTGTLTVTSNDPDTPTATVALRGLGTTGLAGGNEPSLQRILDVHDIPVNVGDNDPGTSVIHSTQAGAKLLGQEIPAPAFRKAGAGDVTIETLAIFGPTDVGPLLRVGHYAPGNTNSRTEVFSVPNVPASNGQTVDVPGGVRAFDPGAAPFGIWSQWPYFQNRLVWPEDALNTWENGKHAVRVYAKPGEPNAYVLATEETTGNGDYQDVVLVLRNVEPVVATSRAEISTENLDEVPFNDRLAFNRIQTPVANQVVHDTSRLRIRNTGQDPLLVSQLAVDGPFELVTPPALPQTVPVGGQLDVTVRFTAQSNGSQNGYHEGTLTIASNDADEGSLPIELAGFWQSVSEGGQEPDMAEITRVFGYGTTIGSPINNGGKLVKIGDEVNSAYWLRADTSANVVVRQLGAFHTQGNTASFRTYPKGSTTNTNRITHVGVDGQSILPRSNASGNPAGKASFAITGAFGIDIDNERSDWTRNTNADEECRAVPGNVCGHHVRIWPAKDRDGVLIPDTYLVGMDYSGINYDFNDNVYLVSNIRPEDVNEDPLRKPCAPLACAAAKVAFPFALDFGAPRSGTVLDRDNEGTGFTWLAHPADGDGYVKDAIDLKAQQGKLELRTSAGISVRAENSQENMLGAGLTWANEAKAITTTLADIPAGTGAFEQGGLWFGRGQRDHIKLNVISRPDGLHVEHLMETADGDPVSTQTPVLPLAGKRVQLKLVANPALERVSAYFTIEGQAQQALGSYTVPASWFSKGAPDPRVGTTSFAGIHATHRNGTAPLVYTFEDFEADTDDVAPRPTVLRSRPANGETNVVRDVAIATDLALPNGSVKNASVTAQTIRLVRVSDGVAVPGTHGTSGGGDTLTFTPAAPLAANAQYRFEITDGVLDLADQPFEPYSATFTTGTATSGTGGGTSGAAFDRITLPTATAPQFKGFTSLAIGPDDKLYGIRNDGLIQRWPRNADGTLGQPEQINSLRAGGDRLAIGLTFDPAATAQNPVVWVSHTSYGFADMPNWGGKITRLSGPDLGTVQDYVVGLPRSSRDHVTNSIAIKDGKLYVLQGSLSAMGGKDTSWGNRDESLLSAAVLELDPAKVANPPLNVQTAEGGNYDPFAANAPLTIYATGIRNAYDLLWHSNGSLYTGTNGSAAGGNVPATTNPLPARCANRINGAPYGGATVPGITNITETQHDFLFRIVKGGYYGHPNPTRCEWVLNGGNPTSGADTAQVSQYPSGTQPDANWRGAAFDFGLNKSPNGTIEYKSNAFGGTLKGKLLVVRYSNNDDLIALTPGPNGDIIASQSGIPGANGPFKDPLDVVEDQAGNLYVSEYDQLGNGPKITLLRVREGSGGGTGCAPVSSLSCAEVKAPDAYVRDFAADGGGLADKDGQGTGFRMTQPSSNGGAYLPDRLDLDTNAGTLQITSTAGIQYKRDDGTTPPENALDNGLGVGLDTTRAVRLETTLVAPPAGTNQSEQGGLWFGPSEDDYAKLVVVSTTTAGTTSHKLQMVREIDGNSSTADEVNGPSITTLAGQTVRLVLEADPATRTVTGRWAVGGGELQTLGSLVVPQNHFDGTLVAANARAAGIAGYGGIFATHRRGAFPSGLAFRFGEFRAITQPLENAAPVIEPIAARTDEAGTAVSLPVQASDPNGDVLAFAATGLPAGLAIDAQTGAITGKLAADAVRPEPYEVTVTATDAGSPAKSASVTFAWTVVAPPPAKPVTTLKVNFQRPTTATPDGYVGDWGQPFALRPSEHRYGWVRVGTSTPLDLSVGGTLPGNARERNVQADKRLDTFMHMQADDVPNFNGTPAEGAWELAVPDGTYDVTVAVGEPNVGADPESHTVRVEGVPAVSNFVPSGAAGAATRHTTGRVAAAVVTDGRLTLDAIGGTNTKIDYVDIVNVSNKAPEVAAVADRGDERGLIVSQALSATDPDAGQTFTWSATGLPQGLAIDPATGAITGKLTAAPGAYDVVVTATDSGVPAMTDDEAFTWTVTAIPGLPGAPVERKVNFQNAAGAVPAGYLRDFGQPFGPRTDANQGTGLRYGWVTPGTTTGVDLSVGGTTPGNGRDRGATPADRRLATLMHMQADQLPANFNGTRAAGAWEIAVPDGLYDVTVSVGDQNVGTDPTFHTIRVEGRTIIDRYNQTANGAFRSAKGRAVAVADGRLTIDAIGGTNTKINYVDLVPAANAAPVLAVADRTDEAGTKLHLPLAAADADGDAITFAATGLPAGLVLDPATGVITGTAPAAGETATVTVTATDDFAGGTLADTETFTWTFAAPPEPAPLDAFKVNFQPDAAPVPDGYAKDTGLPYGDRADRRFGWVRPGTNAGADLVPNTRDRNVAGVDQRLDTLIHMQPPANSATMKNAGAWEIAVPDGFYDVTVGVGDPTVGADPESHVVRAEGVVLIDPPFAPTGAAGAGTRHTTGTATHVRVTDGRLTLDAVGGTNTKLAYVDLARSANRAPVLTDPSDRSTPEHADVDLDLAASDADGDALEWAATGLPDGLAIDAQSGAITGTVAAGTGTREVTVTVTDGTGSDSATFTWTVTDGTAPTITGRAPVAGAVDVALDAAIRAEFSEPLDPAGLQLALARGGTSVAGESAYAGGALTFTPAAALLPGRQYTATISGARDLAGNALPTATWTFTTVAPLASALEASATEVDFGTVAEGARATRTLTLTNAGAGPAHAEIAIAGGTLGGANPGRFDEDLGAVTLAPGASKTVTVGFSPDAVGPRSATLTVDHDGTDAPLAIALSGTGADLAAPAVTAVSPADGATGVDPAANVTATFSEPMAADTLTAATFALRTNGTAVPAQVSYDAATRTATLDPAAALVRGATYAVTLDGAKDAAGNAAPARSWSFTVTAPPSAIRINAGGPARTVGGVSWDGCTAVTACGGRVSGGTAYTKSPQPAFSKLLPGTDATLMSSEWTGGQASGVPAGATAFTFDVPVTDGEYLVRLHFADNNQAAGNRRFDVDVEGGGLELDDFDISAAAGGMHKPIVREWVRTVTDGSVTIRFGTVLENAMVNAIEILPAAGNPADTTAPGPVTGLEATAGDGRADLAWANPGAADFGAVRILRSTAGAATSPEPGGGQQVVYDGLGTSAAVTGLANGTAQTFTAFTRDAAGNWSAPVSVTATPKAPTQNPGTAVMRVNLGGPAATVGGVQWASCQTAGDCAGVGVLDGAPFATSTAIAGVAAPASQAIYQRGWTGGTGLPTGQRAFGFDLFLPNGQYTLRLHFADVASTQAGQRVFGVNVDMGGVELPALDVVAAAGGPARAHVREFTVNLQDGKLDVDLLKGAAGVPFINAIEVLTPGGPPPVDTTPPGPVTGLSAAAGDGSVALSWSNPGAADLAAVRVLRSAQGPAASPDAPGQAVVYEGLGTSATATGLPNGTLQHFTVFARDAAGNWSVAATASATPAATPPPGPAALRVNMGGPAVTGPGGVAWSGCLSAASCGGIQVFGGFQYAKQPAPAITGMVSPAPASVYQSEWTGGQTNGVPAGQRAFGYDVPLPAGTYRVRLHFAENVQDSVGDRLFDVNLEGGPKELVSFDIFAQAGGMNRAIVREFTLPVTDGELDLDFIRVKENAKLSALEILPVQAQAAVAPVAARLALAPAAAPAAQGTAAVTVAFAAPATAAAPEPRRLTVECRTSKSRFRPVGVVTVRGAAARLKLPRRHTFVRCRVRFAGDGQVKPAVSRAARVKPGKRAVAIGAKR